MKLKILLFALLVSTFVWGQTPYVMSGGNYLQDFANISGWTSNYASGTGAANWRTAVSVNPSSVLLGSTTVFSTSTAQGVQKGAADMIILATGTNSTGTDLLLDFTGRTAGTISLNWAKVTNTVNASPKSSDLKIQYSTDDGGTFTDLSGYSIPRINNSAAAESGSLSSITLPSALDNQAAVVIRFYVWNNGQTGGSGNRPKFSIDNVSITSSVLPAPVVSGSTQSGTVGTAFSYFISATNTPTGYALATGTLPAGLSLNTTTGEISGTPTAAGSTSVTVTATNGGGTSAPATINFNIALPPVPVVTGSSQSGTVGVAFSYTVVATNSPTSYAVSSGTLPAGLTLNASTGVISGTPSAAGSPSVSVTATNAGGTSAPATINFTISLPPAPVVTPGSPSGTQGSVFSYSVVASNSPTSYAVSSGTLPVGLSLNTSTGVISGTPTGSGSTSVNITATNAGGTSAPATFNFSIAAVAVPVVTGGSASGTVGIAFTYTISATNSPNSYAVSSGTLPNGLALNTTTGVISGTPTANGSFSVSVTATNGGGTSSPATVSFTIAIPASTCYTTNFETISSTIKTGYAAEEVALDNGVNWYLDQCLVATTAQDYRNGTASLRMKNDTAALFEMDQDQVDGLSTIAFNYRNYNTDVNSTIYAVEYSKDSGMTWINIGSISPTASVQSFNYTLNQAGPVRIHIKYSSGLADGTKRFNIDDLVLCNYNLNKEIEVTGNSANIINGSSTVLDINNTDYGNTYFVGDAAIVKTFIITNRGTSTLTISSLSISPTTNFTITSGPSATSLASGQTSIFTVSFSATNSGQKTAVVTIGNDDADENPFTFTVSAYSNSYTKCTLQAKSTIAQQDFETSPASPVLTFTPAVISGTATVGSAAGSNYGQSTSATSAMYIGGKSYQIAGAATVSGNTLTSASIDASSYQNVQMSFNLGAYATTSAQGLETKDQVTIYISEDGGTTWNKQIVITGNNNAIWDINNATGATKTRSYDATTYVTFAPASGSVNTFSKLFKITNLPNVTQLAVKFEIKYATKPNSSEIFAIDNVIFEGQLPQTSTWSGSWDVAPTSTAKAVINANYDMTSLPSFSACDCKINAGKTVTIAAGKYMEIQSDITNNGTIIVENNGSLVQVDDAAVNTGNITYKRSVNMKKMDYVYWSAPVINFPVTSVSPTTSSSYIFKWLPTQSGNFGAWINANEDMIPGKGYIIRGPSGFDNVTLQTFNAVFSGFPNSGVITSAIERGNYTGANYTNPANNVTVTKFDDNYNLVGNPYPSSINAISFLTANTNIDGTIRLWTHGTLPNTSATNPFYGNYQYNYANTDYIIYNSVGTSTGPGVFNGYIASGQGFFVTMNDGIADNTQFVTFNNSMRSKTYDNSQFYRHNNAASDAGDADTSRIWLDLVGPNNAVNRTLVGYIDGATTGKDRMFDAVAKLSAGQEFYSIVDDLAVNIQGRPTPFDTSDVVPLGFKATANENYKIAIAAIDGTFQSNSQPIYLEDKVLNIIHDLKQAPYSFNSGIGIFDGRFALRYSNALATENFQNSNSIVVASGKNEIKIKSYAELITSVAIYDVLGREIFSNDQVGKSDLTITNLMANSQALVIKIKLASGQTVTRKIIY